MNIFQWSPFTYVCEGYDGKIEEVGGFFPIDVRDRCHFPIKRIHGPMIKGFWSWLMYQICRSEP